MQTFHDYLRSDLGQLLTLTFAATAAIQCLIAIWAATARRHWFLRALAVWGGVMLLVAIRAFEPAAIFACAAPLTMTTIAAANWMAHRLTKITVLSTTPTGNPAPLSVRDMWGSVMTSAVAVVAIEPLLQGHWWFDPIAVAAWGIILAAVIITIYDFAACRGRATRQRSLALFRLATTSLRWASTSLSESRLSSANAEIAPPATPKFRFALRDLFYAMLVVALIVVGIQATQHGYTWQDWLAFAAWGALLAAITALAYGCAVSRWRLVLAPLLIVAVIAAGWITPRLCHPFITEKFLEALALGRAFSWNGAQKQMAVQIVYAEAALLIMVVTTLSCLTRERVAGRAVRTLARSALATLALAGGIPLVWLYWQMFWITPIPLAFAGGTTHYARIAEIVSHADRNWWSPTQPWVPHVAGDKDELIAELADLTRNTNYIPFVVEDRQFQDRDFEAFRRALDHFRSFSQVIDAEAAAASSQGDDNRAVDLCLLIIRLGTMLQRGGTESHAMNGEWCQAIAYKRLTQLRSRLDPATVRGVIAALQHAATDIEDRAIISARGQAFIERTEGWSMRLRNVFRQYGWRYPDPYIATQRNLLQTELAIALFRDDHDRWPSSLDELVPNYLPAVPLDPLAAMPIGSGYPGKVQTLRYRLDDDTYVLYSVGVFSEDNGGNFASENDALHSSMYDVDLETWLRP